MSLILSSDVGRALTSAEIDSNNQYLQNLANSETNAVQALANQATTSATTAASAASTAATQAADSAISQVQAAIANSVAQAAASAALASTLNTALDPVNQVAPLTLDGSESWSFKKAGLWAKATVSAVANFVLSVYNVAAASGISGVVRTVSAMLFDQPVSVKNFGVIGDGIAADSAALQKAYTWWTGGNERRLLINDGMLVRINYPVLADFSGIARPGTLEVKGCIQPDAGIGYATTYLNMRGGRVDGKVCGGGQTANYSQANPTGCDEAYRFVNVYGTSIKVEGSNYQGRCLRVTSDSTKIGPDGFKTQWVTIENISTNSSAAITAIESTRLAQGVGQSFYIDTGTNAFGSINKAFLLWELYGPVIDNTTDVTLHDMETLWRGNTGMQCRQVISFWGKTLKLGSELTGTTMQLLSFVSQNGVDCQNVCLDTVFAVGGYDGVYAENIGRISGQGLTIKNLVTRTNTNTGLTLNNCTKFDIQTNQWADGVNLWLTGACGEGRVKFRSSQSKNQNIIIDSAVSGQIFFEGEASNGNINNGSGISLIQVSTTNPISFDHFLASSGSVDYLYNLPSSNNTRIRFGGVTTAGGSQIFNNQPNRSLGVRGLVTMNAGTATIASGQSSVTVAHGMYRAPDFCLATGRSSGGSQAFVSVVDNTNITISIPSNAASSLTVNWAAWTNFGVA